MKISRTVAATVGMFAALALTACAGGGGGAGSQGDAGDAEPAQIALFEYAFGNTYSEVGIETAEKWAEENGVELTVFASDFDATKQFNQVQDAVVTQKYDGFVIGPNDGNTLRPAIQQALDAGIKVSCIGTPCGTEPTSEIQIDGLTAQVSPSFDTVGMTQGELTTEACEGIDPCTVAYMLGVASAPFDIARLEAFKQVIAEHDNIELVAEASGGYSTDGGFTASQNVLSAHPDLTVFTSGGDYMAVGIERAADRAGRDDLIIIGEGSTVEGVDALERGAWFGTTCSQPIYEMTTALDATLADIRGELDEPLSVNILESPGCPSPAITIDEVEAGYEAQF